jgi:hypothetical protein
MGHDIDRGGDGGPCAPRSAPAALRAALSELIEQRGLRGAAEDLFIHERTLARAAAGASVREGTIELVRSRLRELREDEAAERGSHLQLVPQRGPEPLGSVLGRVLAGLADAAARDEQ